mgnify:CR=1 FL=1
MYNEIAGREFARNRMREAWKEVKNARMLALLEDNSPKEADRRATTHPGNSIQHVLKMFTLRGGMAGLE